MATQYDVIIIGSGAGGGTLARHLAPSGKRILLLERGDWLKREPENWIAEEVFVKNRYVSPDIWHDKHGKPFQPGVHYFVGGATKMYGAALYRLRKEDFGERQHQDGISPAWPISYDELEPYYTEGRADVPRPRCAAAKIRPSRRRARRIPYPARVARAADRRSWPTIWRGPATIRFIRRAASCSTKSRMPFSRCVRCIDCDGFPCLVHAKSDAEVLGVRPALEYPNVTLLTNAHGAEAGNESGRHRGDRSRRQSRRPAGNLSRPASSSSPAARPTRPSCC